jgi:hypothetical protein
MLIRIRAFWIFALAIILSAATVHTGLAQSETIRLSNLQIDLWPEYDRAAVLVIYRITLSEDTARPAEIAIRLPPSGEVNAVAVTDVDGQLMSVNFEEETSGAWKLIRFQATMPEIQVEYYDSNLSKDGSIRSFTYQWAGDMAVDQALAVIQQPIGASDLTVSPGPTTSQQSGDGLTYFTKDIGSLAVGQAFQLNVRYSKDSKQLSVESMEVQPLDESSTNAVSNQDSQLWLIGLLVLVGVSLIAGGSLWYWRTAQKSTPARRQRSRASQNKARSAFSENAEVYCHKCGRRASAGDRFCRGCGERLRT